MPKSKQKHVRIVCPHCGKHVSLQRPRTRLGFVKPVACPSCHIPISPAHIKAQTEPLPQPPEEAGDETESAEETAQADEGEDQAEPGENDK